LEIFSSDLLGRFLVSLVFGLIGGRFFEFANRLAEPACEPRQFRAAEEQQNDEENQNDLWRTKAKKTGHRKGEGAMHEKKVFLETA
jgi:hypothetical protein